jgi:AcrR family transcriptional regulator
LAEAETRVLRADATRNRNQLLEVATRVFVSAGTEPSMRAIAREAGVGIATLYRHFPTRESLVDAVYRDQVARLTGGARELLVQLPPPAALRRWMELFGDWIATKGAFRNNLSVGRVGIRHPLYPASSDLPHRGRPSTAAVIRVDDSSCLQERAL